MRNRKRLYVFILAACLIAALVQSASFADFENEETESAQHVHEESCYAQEGDLLCGQEESEIHTHDDTCYAIGGELICDLQEAVQEENEEEQNQNSKYEADNNSKKTRTMSISPYNMEESDTELAEDTVAVIDDAQYVTLQSALDSAEDGDTVTLLKDVKENISSSEKNYTLDLQNHTVTGTGSSYVYRINGGVVYLKNGTITGGVCDSYCGGLYVSSGAEVHTYGLSIEKNTGAYGGGVFVYNSSFYADKTSISENTSSSSKWYGGGGIFLWSSSAELTDCVVEKNTSNYNGGGIYLKDDNGCSLKINGERLDDNSAAQKGGAVYAGGSVELYDVEVKGNEAGSGGGIYAKGPAVIENAEITDNTASSDGGGIYAYNSLSLKNSRLLNNRADNGGGGGLYVSYSDTEIVNTEITGNTAKTEGGGASLWSSSNSPDVFMLKNVTFSRNGGNENTYRGIEGAALYIMNGDLTAEDCSITGNHAAEVPTDSIVALGGFGLEASFSGTHITGNSGAVSTVSVANGNIAFSSSIIKSNEARLAGAINMDSYKAVLKITDTVITGNSSDSEEYASSGGILAAAGSTVTMESGALYKNSCAVPGGGRDIYAEKNANMDIIHPSDMEDGDIDFSEYIWQDNLNHIDYIEKQPLQTDSTKNRYLTAVKYQPRDIARIGDITYSSLFQAVDAAQPGDTILLIAGENDELGNTFSSSFIEIDKNLTIDFNGRNILGNEDNVLKVKDAAKLSITGKGSIDGSVTAEGEGILEINGDISIKKIVHKGNSLVLNGDIGTGNITLGEDKFITAGSSFHADSLEITLDKTVLDRLNGNQNLSGPVILIENCADKELLSEIIVKGLNNPLISAVISEGNIVLQREIPGGIYLNGISGDDSNDGTSYERPVKTFAKAKEILEQNGLLHTIFITGTVTVTGEETWSLQEGQMLQRYPNYTGKLVTVNGAGAGLDLENIVIDGAGSYGGKEGRDDCDSLIVCEKGTLNLKEGAVLQNNLTSARRDMTFGGGVYVSSEGTLRLSGGTVKGCTALYGGGIYASGTVILDSGLITENRAVQSEKSVFPGDGGGICIAYDGKLLMNGGIVSGNKADNGGGVSIGGKNSALVTGCTPSFEMNEGAISDNTASGSGGGIYIECNGDAVIRKGKIENNVAKGESGALFAGGGIYVNGGRQSYGVENGNLQLYNTVITDNYAGSNGGGIAGCPTSDVRIYLSDGGAIYRNSAQDKAEDVYADSGTVAGFSGTATMYVSEYMLGGGMNLWKYGKGSLSEGESVPINFLHNVSALNARNGAKSEAAAKAESLAQVWITGNQSATSGGGIGANGDVIIGTAPSEEDVVDISVKKVWKDEGREEQRPDVVRVWLLQDGVPLYYVSISPDAYGNWPEVKFTDQPKTDESGREYVYTVKEDAQSLKGNGGAYESVITGENLEFVITNTAVFTGNLMVSKTVSGSGADQSRTFVFTVTLSDTSVSGIFGDMNFKEGKAEFTLKHGESKTATGLPEGISYEIRETGSGGYTVSVNGTVSSIAKGTIKAGETTAAVFNNQKENGEVITPDPAEVTLKAQKTLNGAAPSGSDFTFVLKDQDGNILQAKKNISGEITFDTLRFSQEGTYIYYISEQPESGENIVYDPSVYKVTVTVTKFGKCYASVAWEKDGAIYTGTPVFENTIKDKPEDPDNPSLPDDPEKPGKPDQPENPDTPDKPDRPGADGGQDEDSSHTNETAPDTGDSQMPAMWAILLITVLGEAYVICRLYKRRGAFRQSWKGSLSFYRSGQEGSTDN